MVENAAMTLNNHEQSDCSVAWSVMKAENKLKLSSPGIVRKAL